MAKVRHDFVTNSSSSSYIVIGTDKNRGYEWEGSHIGLEMIVDSDFGHGEFGWEVTDYRNVPDRIMFAYLQAESVKNNAWFNMLEEVIQEHTGCIKIVWKVTNDYIEYRDNPELLYGYIDHQSAASEGENTEMFASKDSLRRFLFHPDSYIHGDNDNY